MMLPESSPWYLAAVVEVTFDDRIQCQCKGCGRIAYRAVHLVVWEDGRIECWGSRCYERELGATPQGKNAKPKYDSVAGRKLTLEERELLKTNREQLIAGFRQERQRREQAKRERQEALCREAEEGQQSARRVLEQSKHRRTTSQIGPIREREGICEICATKTDDWWFYNGETGTCLCRNCQRQGKTQPGQ